MSLQESVKTSARTRRVLETLADRNWSATLVSVAVISSRNSSTLAAVGMIVAVPAAAFSVGHL